MRLDRHLEAQVDDGLLRWELENELTFGYDDRPLTTRSREHNWVKRVSPERVIVVDDREVRVKHWPLGPSLRLRRAKEAEVLGIRTPDKAARRPRV